MIRLVVWITLPSSECVRCGEIVCSDPDRRGRIAGAFRYTAEWLNHSNRFALDPNELPLSEKEYLCDSPRGIFAAFEDSLPDDWGRRLLIRKARLDRSHQNLPNLLQALNGAALGALAYYPEKVEAPKRYFATTMELESLVKAALSYEARKRLDDAELRMLFTAASSPGGARPKALVRTDNGDQWIAKFPSTKDMMPMVPLEAATLSLAQKAGLWIPNFRIEQCGKYKVLLIKRFDISKRSGRRHMISFQTLMQAQGYYTLGYLDLFEVLRKVTAKPISDLPALYRQMVFNALIGNTDDHLKNFSLLHDDSGFYLSPAYDLLPDVAERREHVLHFNSNFYFPGIDQLITMGKHAKINTPAEIVDQIRSVISDWENEFKRWGVTKDDIAQLSYGINERIRI